MSTSQGQLHTTVTRHLYWSPTHLTTSPSRLPHQPKDLILQKVCSEKVAVFILSAWVFSKGTAITESNVATFKTIKVFLFELVL